MISNISTLSLFYPRMRRQNHRFCAIFHLNWLQRSNQDKFFQKKIALKREKNESFFLWIYNKEGISLEKGCALT